VQPGIGQDMLALLRSPQPPPTEALLTQLINDIAAIPFEFALVLDDYHTIGAHICRRKCTSSSPAVPTHPCLWP